MKFFLIAFAVIAAVSADVSHLPSAYEYLPPEQGDVNLTPKVPANDYLPPVQQVQPEEHLQDVQYQVPDVQTNSGHVLADDGYHYKTNRRVVYRFRHRRDVSHLPQNQYLPPSTVYQAPSVDVPNNQYLPPALAAAGVPVAPVPAVAPVPSVAPVAPFPAFGGQGNSEIVQGFQHNPVQNPVVQVYNPAPFPDVKPVTEPLPAHNLAEDGYHYKTNRRVVYRHRQRRDVSHLPQYQYLPPAQQENSIELPNNQYLAPFPVAPLVPVAPEPDAAHEVAPVGPASSVDSVVVPNAAQPEIHSNVAAVYNAIPAAEIPKDVVQNPIDPIPAHTLAEDGYHYKSNRRVVYRYRHRRDVSHLPSNEYLPPGQENSVEEPKNEYLAPATKASSAHEEVEPAHTVSDDGYHYKTQRRVVYRRQ